MSDLCHSYNILITCGWNGYDDFINSILLNQFRNILCFSKHRNSLNVCPHLIGVVIDEPYDVNS